jgi:hypothetical protein
MAKYGTRRYGSGFRYGEPSPVGVYYEANLIATATNYGTIQVTWSNIIVDPADSQPTHWKLVKSYVGSLDDPDAGIRLAGGLYTTFTNSYVDTPDFYVSQEAHYSLWVYSPGANGIPDKWIACGSDYEILVEGSSTISTITRWIPKAWLNPTTASIGDGVGEDENNTFYKVLSAYAFQYDKLRAQATLLNLHADPVYTPSLLLRYGVTDQSHTYEPSLGDNYHRSLYSAGNILNAYKGTILGISAYTTSLTHWSNDVKIGHNLMLDYNDSSFEESIGRWSASSGTFAQKTYAAESLTVLDKTQMLYDPIFKPRLLGFGQLTTAATTAVTLTLPGTGQDITSYGIPVKENTRYLFNGWVRHRDNAGTVAATITWYNMFGATISTVTAPTATTTTTAWKEFTTKSVSGRNGSLSPRGAKFAKVTITVTPSSSSSSRFAFDFFQFAEAYKSFEYQDAKLILVEVNGEKENYIPNGSFEDGLAGWSSVNAAAAIEDANTDDISTYGVHGKNALKLTASASEATFVSDWLPIDTGSIIVFSAYVLGTSADTVIARVDFSSPSSEEAQTTILSDTEGQYYPTTVYSVSSEPMTLSTTEKKQIYVAAIAPPYSKDAGHPLAQVSLYFPSSVNTRNYYIDGAMIENRITPSRYFSGIGGIAATDPSTQQYYSPDYTRWETKNLFNYISNPSFETNTTDWSSTGTLTRTTLDASLAPLYGAAFGKVAYTTSTTLTNTVHLPYAASGQEDFIVSAYVRGAVATYTINGTVYTIASGDESVWHRISGVYRLTTGDTTLDWTISVANTAGSTSTYFHIDGAQGEYGRIPRKFVDPSDGPNTTVIANPVTSGKSLYAIQAESTHSGKANYLNNYSVKISRLQNTLSKYMPNGSSFAIKTGHEFYDYRDLDQSLIPNNSFEKSLGDWYAVGSFLSREISRGAYFNENVTHGQAYCKVTNNTPAAFGIASPDVPIVDDGSYYASVAVRLGTANTTGPVVLTVEFYNALNQLVYTKTATKTITSTDRWAYIANTYSVADIGGASYARFIVLCTPTAGYIAGQNIHVDRAVFRQ